MKLTNFLWFAEKDNYFSEFWAREKAFISCPVIMNFEGCCRVRRQPPGQGCPLTLFITPRLFVYECANQCERLLSSPISGFVTYIFRCEKSEKNNECVFRVPVGVDVGRVRATCRLIFRAETIFISHFVDLLYPHWWCGSWAITCIVKKTRLTHYLSKL